MWNVFKKVWVKGKGVKAVLSDACNIGYADGGDVTNGERTLSPQHFPRRSSLRMRGSRQHEFRFLGTLTYRENKDSLSWMPDQVGHDVWDDTTPSDIPSPSVSSRRPLLSETGRSMIEMLGVLAIIGVLSIAAVAGYRFALLKFRANEVTNELNMRAIDLSAQIDASGKTYSWEEPLPSAFGNLLAAGFETQSYISALNNDYFRIDVFDLPTDLCRQILRDYDVPVGIFVGKTELETDTRYTDDLSLCGDENDFVDMGFIYKNDLGATPSCGWRAEFDVDELACHCSGNTYLNMTSNECFCPAGHIWSDQENTCIESICNEGEFESLSNGCVSCDEEKTYQVIKGDTNRIALCEACPNRRYLKNYGYCVNMNSCPLGEKFLSAGPNIGCYACTTLGIFVNPDDVSGEGCQRCGGYLNKENSSTTPICAQNITCTDRQFKKTNGSCVSCDTPETIRIGENDTHHALCIACGNRSVQNNNCVKTTCSSDEFMGSDGTCHLCTTEQAVAVNTDSGCETETCGREVLNGMCILKTCDTENNAFVRLSDGSCYDCNSKEPFKVFSESECDACMPSRRLVVASGSQLCMLESLCTKGINYPQHYGSICNSCNSKGAACDTGAFGQEYCEACGNHHMVKNFCVRNDACTKGSQFSAPDWSYQVCQSCTLSTKIEIGTHEVERQLCRACTTEKRFWAGSYCYPCTSNESPSVTSDAEKDSCLSCTGQRIVQDGKCVLVQ